MEMMNSASGQSRTPTIAELRAVCQEPIRAAALWQDPLYRHLSAYLTWVAVRLNRSPNQITLLSLAAGLAAGLLWLDPRPLALVLAAVLLQVDMILDYVDGEVARWTGRASVSGRFVEGIGGDVTDPLILIGLAWGAASSLPDPWSGWTLALGVLGALSQLVFRWTPVVLLASITAVYMGRVDRDCGEATPQPSEQAGPHGSLGRLFRRVHPIFSRCRAPFFHPNFLILLTPVAAIDAIALATLGELPATTAVVCFYGVATPCLALWQILYAATSGVAEHRYRALYNDRRAFRMHL